MRSFPCLVKSRKPRRDTPGPTRFRGTIVGNPELGCCGCDDEQDRLPPPRGPRGQRAKAGLSSESPPQTSQGSHDTTNSTARTRARQAGGSVSGLPLDPRQFARMGGNQSLYFFVSFSSWAFNPSESAAAMALPPNSLALALSPPAKWASATK